MWSLGIVMLPQVINLMLTHALLAGWARMFVYHLLHLLHRHFSPFNLFIQMFGHHPFIAILVINITLSFLTITRITYGQFHFVINLMFFPPFERSSLTFILNFAYPSSLSRLTMDGNMTPLPCVSCFLLLAPSCVSPARIRRSKTVKPKEFSALLTIVCAPC